MAEFLKGKKIIVGVAGSIAAYKSAYLVRLLVKAGAEVQVVMTPSATGFITPLTLATLSGRPALSAYAKDEEGTWNNHVALGLWADALLIAPATARTLAKCATGLCDDLLTAVYLSARCPAFFAPAMDLDMYRHPSTQRNLELLTSYGNTVIDAEEGPLASGLEGQGRMAEPETLVKVLLGYFSRRSAAVGKRVLITAGPTQEAIDPVRYVSNHSSGKMGFALARAFAYAGAGVTLVSGPVALELDDERVKVVRVRSAQEMFVQTERYFEGSDAVVFAAAVADYAPREPAAQKIKKKGEALTVELNRTVDIAATLGARKKASQLLVGFALETDREMENARRKLTDKRFDFIVLNSLNDEGAGFAHDTNKITVIEKDSPDRYFELKSKDEVAQDILEIIIEKWSEV